MTRLRIGLALAGIAVAVLAVVTDHPRIGWAAIALLLASLVVRLWQRRRAAR